MPRTQLCVMVLFSIYAAELLMIAVMPFALRPRPDNRPCDLAVVFGNAITATGQPSPRLKARLDEAFAQFQAGQIKRILVSGGVEPGPSAYSEPVIMAAYLEARGVPSAALIQDAAGLTTAATAANTARLAAPSNRILLVTQWFHVARAALAMRQHGRRNLSAACPRYFEWRDFYSLVRESIALPAYLVKPR